MYSPTDEQLDVIGAQWLDQRVAYMESQLLSWFQHPDSVCGSIRLLCEKAVDTIAAYDLPLGGINIPLEKRDRVFVLLIESYRLISRAHSHYRNMLQQFGYDHHLLQMPNGLFGLSVQFERIREVYLDSALPSCLSSIGVRDAPNHLPPLNMVTVCGSTLRTNVRHIQGRLSCITSILTDLDSALTQWDATHLDLSRVLGFDYYDERFGILSKHFYEALLEHVQRLAAVPVTPALKELARSYETMYSEDDNNNPGVYVRLAETDDILLEGTRGDEWTNPWDLWLCFPMHPADEPYFTILRDNSFIRSSDMHPHISSDGHICLGDSSAVGRKHWRDKDLVAYADLCQAALHCYEGDSAYWRFDESRYVQCYECGEDVHEEDVHRTDCTGHRNYEYCRQCYEELFQHCEDLERDTLASEWVYVEHGPFADSEVSGEYYLIYLQEHPLPPKEPDDAEETPESESEAEAEEATPADAVPQGA